MSYVRAGARGKLSEPEDDFTVFEDMLTASAGSFICRMCGAAGCGAQVLYYKPHQVQRDKQRSQ
jgi:hypothetical protein